MDNVKNLIVKLRFWLFKGFKGVIISYILTFSFLYGLSWVIIEPLGISDTFEPPSFTHYRIFYQLIIILIIAPIILLFIKRQNYNHQISYINNSRDSILELIGLNKEDTSILNCWQIVEHNDPSEPHLNRVNDDVLGEVLEITSKRNYAIDYNVKTIAKRSSSFEYITIPNNGHVLYLRVNLNSKTENKYKDGWIALNIDKSEHKPHADGSQEWWYSVTPENLKGEWIRYNVNLEEIVRETFGKSGWQYNQLIGIRLRGNAKIKNIIIKK